MQIHTETEQVAGDLPEQEPATEIQWVHLQVQPGATVESNMQISSTDSHTSDDPMTADSPPMGHNDRTGVMMPLIQYPGFDGWYHPMDTAPSLRIEGLSPPTYRSVLFDTIMSDYSTPLPTFAEHLQMPAMESSNEGDDKQPEEPEEPECRDFTAWLLSPHPQPL